MSVVCGLNIFINIVLIGAYAFPDFIFPIDWNDSAIAKALMETDVLATKRAFYLFPDFFQQNAWLLYKIALFTAFLYFGLSIIGSLMYRKFYVFTLTAVLMNFLWAIVFPPQIGRWEIDSLFMITVNLNAFILGVQLYQRFSRSENKQ